MSTSTKFDLSTESGVTAYLSGTPFACTGVQELSGGNANYSFRLKLCEPYKDRETAVLKHAKPFVKSMKEMTFGVERQIYEVAALRQVRSWLPNDSVVTVPEVYHFDEDEHAIIMEDAGINSMTLKAFMKEGKATPALATNIGRGLGAFLGGLHTWGKGNIMACKSVEGNQHAKDISAWYFFGRITETLRGAEDVPKLSDPPLDIRESDFQVLDKIQEDTRIAMLAAQDSFVQGDFWPGNIMIALDQTGNLKNAYVLDWEAAKAGLPGIDAGQFSAEVHLLRRFYSDACGETATILFDSFVQEYKRVGSPSSEDMRLANIQVGAHLIVLAARVPWGEKELTREVVREGVTMVVSGSGILNT
ncbi:kinase-like domain-containing protein [Crepidotus variabilis]|uniref:Kinase-like domain-containing protein n=1 Tax=Crepidotus variabilis TaxID=179855 RepID=A0A9P6ELQ4_9AGAR|nr:kinase-like domain-containing protein [Crepidotus variabilis]